jgi:type I site-specific restriction-modification system R (restriction) subunit
MEETQRGISPSISVDLVKLKDEINAVKEQDNILQKEESRAKAAREALKPEIERLGRILQDAGLESFSTGLYDLVQEESEYWSFTEEGKRECIQFLDDQGMFEEAVQVPTLNTRVRAFVAQGIEVPGVKVFKKWTVKIKKG